MDQCGNRAIPIKDIVDIEGVRHSRLRIGRRPERHGRLLSARLHQTKLDRHVGAARRQ